MKALSLWQPWASLVAYGHKRVETRCWSTNYRGPLLICSTASTAAKVRRVALAVMTDPKICPVASEVTYTWTETGLPEGRALAVVDLLDVVPAEDWRASASDHGRFEDVDREAVLGDLSDGRFAWVLTNVRRLDRPLRVKGRQRLWTPGAALVEEVLHRVAA